MRQGGQKDFLERVITRNLTIGLCGGEVSEIVTDLIENKQLKKIIYDTNLTQNLGGILIDIKEQINILEMLRL